MACAGFAPGNLVATLRDASRQSENIELGSPTPQVFNAQRRDLL